jgi:hypothetical protein
MAVRRRSSDGQTLTSRSVTVLEPAGASPLGVGRVESPPGSVVIVVVGSGATEHLAINLEPGTQKTLRLADGRTLATNGLAVRVRGEEIVLAGGTFAEVESVRVEHDALEGRLVRADEDAQGRGIFDTDRRMEPDPELVGRTLLIRHGDGRTRGWTVSAIEPLNDGTRIHVRERAGFRIDPRDGTAVSDQFPGTRHPGPQHFAIARMSR